MGSPLHQFVAVAQGHRKSAESLRTKIYQTLQKSDLYAGFERLYRPDVDESQNPEKLPPESKRVQHRVLEDLAEFVNASIEAARTIATVDVGNTVAKADISVGTKTLAAGVPVSHLLWLEKQFCDLRTVIEKLPVLDAAKSWQKDGNTGLYKTPEETTIRTRKTKRAFEASPATEKHPAQVVVYDEDIPVGKWNRTDYSGALQETERQALLKRVNEVIDATVQARERANQQVVDSVNFAKPIYDYILSG